MLQKYKKTVITYIYVYIYGYIFGGDSYKVQNALAKNQKYAFPENELKLVIELSLHKGHGLETKRKDSEGSDELT